MTKKQLIIFDMDGTLIDSGDVISNTINYVRTNIGLDIMPKNELLTNLNNPDINSSEFFYGTSAFTDEQTELFGKYYHENCIKDILLYNGIKELLETMSKHFILSIATNASVEFARKMTEYLNIDHYFEYIVGSNQVKVAKPHPEMLLNTLESLNIKVEHSILIGDSNKDKNAAVSCGMDYLLVNWGFTQHEEDGVINNADALNKKLLSLR
ncbi:HAD family hydrolase [Arcobacteraceae bacterium]|nr:HAD family hydrolase [Arcobacteraceae bacterium]